MGMTSGHTDLAVQMIRDGRAEQEVVAALVASGTDEASATAEVTRLVALRRRHEAETRAQRLFAEGFGPDGIRWELEHSGFTLAELEPIVASYVPLQQARELAAAAKRAAVAEDDQARQRRLAQMKKAANADIGIGIALALVALCFMLGAFFLGARAVIVPTGIATLGGYFLRRGLGLRRGDG